MRIYFVRHGESEYNAQQLYQHEDVPLSQVGERQAHLIARRFKRIPIDVIFASHYRRARQTAQIINEVVQAPITFNGLLRELKDPTEIEGKPYFEPEAYAIKQLVRQNYFKEDFRHSDEENLYDLLHRARKFNDFIDGYPETHKLVVTHGAIMKAIVALRIFGSTLSTELFQRFDAGFEINNTGITVIHKNGEDQWQITSWNDVVHLR